jgi:hypothetical protein
MSTNVRIVSLEQALKLLEDKLQGDGPIRISMEPEDLTAAKLKEGKGAELWTVGAATAENGKVVGELARVDNKFFAVRMVLHPAFSIWQPLIDQEPGNPIGLSGHRYIGSIIVPVTNLGGRDLLLSEQVSDPLGLGWMTLTAASASNFRKVLQPTDKRIPGAVRFDPNRIASTGGVENYVRWVPPDQIPAQAGLISVRSFVDGCSDNRALGAIAKAFELGPLRPEYRPKA